jgi:hypothetical protein
VRVLEHSSSSSVICHTTGIALRVPGVLKPPHNKVEPPTWRLEHYALPKETNLCPWGKGKLVFCEWYSVLSVINADQRVCLFINMRDMFIASVCITS